MVNLNEIIKAIKEVKAGEREKQSIKKDFGIGAKKYDEIREYLIKEGLIKDPLEIYSVEELRESKNIHLKGKVIADYIETLEK